MVKSVLAAIYQDIIISTLINANYANKIFHFQQTEDNVYETQLLVVTFTTVTW